MSRSIGNKEYYLKQETSIPVKWCSPEVLEYGKFSVQSDCWAFGLVLWELFSYGKASFYRASNTYTNFYFQIPYPGMSNAAVIKAITSSSHYRMEAPVGCPSEIYQLMVDCWAQDPHARPSFKTIYDKVEQACNSSVPCINVPLTVAVQKADDLPVVYSNNSNDGVYM